MTLSNCKRWLTLSALLVLTACGGGGGSSGEAVLGTGSTSTTTPTTVSSTPKLSLSLSATTVTAASPVRATATLTTATGTPLAGQVVKFSARDNLGQFSAASALTDANGQATVNLAPATASTSGADTVVATYQVSDTASVTASAGFQLTATNVTIQSFAADVQSPAALSAYGQTTLTVRLAGTSATVPVTVSVSSACVSKGRATLTPATASVTTGQATFTYRDQGCGSFDLVDGLQAAVVGAGATASLQLNLSAPTASSIAFVSASPEVIYLKGTGLVENSNVVFQVRDANGLGVPERVVVLEPTTLAGGLLLDDTATAVSKKTDSDGKVTVRINSGTVPTPVRIKATLQNTGITTVSSNLAVAVGLPSQLNFSLSQATLNIEGYDIDGTKNTYTIIASDRLGNPVPAGTAVNFVSESGQVQAVGFTSVSNGLGSVAVNFQSASPRPTDGRITVLAYALGEESFLDLNGNNVYDTGEDHQDLGDVFLDRLFNGSFEGTQDQFISLSIAGTSACRTATSTLLQLDSSSPSRSLDRQGNAVNSCVSGWGRAYVRRATQTVLSTSGARPVFGNALPPRSAVEQLTSQEVAANITVLGKCQRGVLSLTNPVRGGGLGMLDGYSADDAINRSTFFPLGSVELYGDGGKTGVLSFLASDANPVAFNPMAAGTVVSAAATSGLSVSVAGGSPVASTLWPTGVALNYTFDDTTTSGTITVTLRSPSGLATSYAQRVHRGPAVPSGLVACN